MSQVLASLSTHARRLADRSSRWSFRRWLLVGFLFYAVAAAGLLARHEWNPSVFVRFGHYYAEQNSDITPTGALVFVGDEKHGGNGYDGQIFYYYARTLFLGQRWPKGFNDAYRAPRVGYPLLAALFVPAGSWGVLAGQLLLQLALVALGGWVLWRMLPQSWRWLLLFYMTAPFTLQSALVGVSDSIMIALQLLGLWFFVGRRSPFVELRSPSVQPIEAGHDDGALANKLTGGFTLSAAAWSDYILAALCFSLAVLTKESALFLLFPLGLLVLLRRDWPRVAVMLVILLPLVAWQFYLRAAHGMVPAGILRIFLSPLDGVWGLLKESGGLLLELSRPKMSTIIALAKLGARLLLLLLIGASLLAVGTGRVRRLLPFRAAIVFTLASVLIADHYYFWSVYENISRMFTPLVPLVLLLPAQDPASRFRLVLPVLGALALLVVLRVLFLTPVFPYVHHVPYDGPSYRGHAPTPGHPAGSFP